MTQVQVTVSNVDQWTDDLPAKESLLDRARARAARERDLSTSAQTAHYAPASLGQSPYVSLPGVGGTVVLRKCGWGC